MSFEVDKVLVVSTAHISEATRDKIHEDVIEGIHAVPRDEYGWMIYVTDLEPEERAAAPLELVKLLDHARERDCTWLMLDCDGPTAEGFDRFNW